MEGGFSTLLRGVLATKEGMVLNGSEGAELNTNERRVLNATKGGACDQC